MWILVSSVHHTGTKVIFQDVLKDLIAISQGNRDKYIPPGKLRIHMDPEPFAKDIHHWAKKAEIIVPLRHPRSVAIGWKSREKRLDWLDAQWKFLKEKVDPYNPFYLPIDRPDKDAWLRKINMALETDFTTDWPVIGQYSGEYAELDEKDERWVKTWMKDGFFKRFGYDYEN